MEAEAEVVVGCRTGVAEEQVAAVPADAADVLVALLVVLLLITLLVNVLIGAVRVSAACILTQGLGVDDDPPVAHRVQVSQAVGGAPVPCRQRKPAGGAHGATGVWSDHELAIQRQAPGPPGAAGTASRPPRLPRVSRHKRVVQLGAILVIRAAPGAGVLIRVRLLCLVVQHGAAHATAPREG